MEKTSDSMNNQAKLGVIAGIMLIGFILIGAVSASVLITSSDNTTEVDLNTMTNEVVDEICSYLQIKQIVGKYQTIQEEQRIKKIAILIKPFVSQNIDLSHMTIELCDGEQYSIFFYSGLSDSIRHSSLFEHTLWTSAESGTYSLLSTIDDDDSIRTSHLINKNTDMAFITIELPDDIAMRYDDSLTITIRPSPGMSRTVLLEAPLPIKNVVSLYQ
jgi:archaellin